MNLHLKGAHMDKKKQQEIVRRGVEAFAKAETALEDFVNAMNELGPLGIEAVNAGLATDPTAAIQEAYELRGMAGKAAELGPRLYRIHKIWAGAAKEKGHGEELPEGYIIALDGGR